MVQSLFVVRGTCHGGDLMGEMGALVEMSSCKVTLADKTFRK